MQSRLGFWQLARSQGITNLDHRLRQTDFASQDQQAEYLSLGMGINELDRLNAGLFIGANIRKDQPIIGHRVRKAAIKGASISFINSTAQEVRFKTTANIAASPAEMLTEVAAVLKAALDLNTSASISANAKNAITAANVSEIHKAIAKSLMDAPSSVVTLGIQAMLHPAFSSLETLASSLATVTNSRLAYLTEGANASGAALAGMLPHRMAGGKADTSAGLNAKAMLDSPLKSYLLLNVEPEFDFADPGRTINSLQGAESVVAYESDALKACADVILPICTNSETAGTYFNIAGTAQSFNGCVPPLGEARPAWKVIRVLANLFGAQGFDYISVEDVLDEIEQQIGNIAQTVNLIDCTISNLSGEGISLVGGVAMYGSNPVVRRAPALQATHDAKKDRQARMNSVTAMEYGLGDGDTVCITQGEYSVEATVSIDDAIAAKCVALPLGTELSAQLGAQNTSITLAKNVEEMRASNA